MQAWWAPGGSSPPPTTTASSPVRAQRPGRSFARGARGGGGRSIPLIFPSNRRRLTGQSLTPITHHHRYIHRVLRPRLHHKPGVGVLRLPHRRGARGREGWPVSVLCMCRFVSWACGCVDSNSNPLDPTPAPPTNNPQTHPKNKPIPTRTTPQTLVAQARESEDNAVKCLVDCLVTCLDNLTQYLNRWAFTYIGIYGHSFTEAGSKVGGWVGVVLAGVGWLLQ